MYKERFGKVFAPDTDDAKMRKMESKTDSSERKAESKHDFDDTCMAKTDDYASFLDEKTQLQEDRILQANNDDDSESDVSGDLEFD